MDSAAYLAIFYVAKDGNVWNVFWDTVCALWGWIGNVVLCFEIWMDRKSVSHSALIFIFWGTLCALCWWYEEYAKLRYLSIASVWHTKYICEIFMRYKGRWQSHILRFLWRKPNEKYMWEMFVTYTKGCDHLIFGNICRFLWRTKQRIWWAICEKLAGYKKGEQTVLKQLQRANQTGYMRILDGIKCTFFSLKGLESKMF